MSKRSKKCIKLDACTAWSAEELNLLMRAFEKDIAACKVPGYGAVERLQARYPLFHQHTCEQIKARVWHKIKKKLHK